MPYVLGDFGTSAEPCPAGSYKEYRTGVCTPCSAGTTPNVPGPGITHPYPAKSDQPCRAIPGYVAPTGTTTPGTPGMSISIHPGSGLLPPGSFTPPPKPGAEGAPGADVGPTVPYSFSAKAMDWAKQYKWYLVGGAVLVAGTTLALVLTRKPKAAVAPATTSYWEN